MLPQRFAPSRRLRRLHEVPWNACPGIARILGSDVAASTASLHFVASGVDGTRPSPNHNAYQLAPPVEGDSADSHGEIVLQCLGAESEQVNRPSQEGQEASSSKAGLPLASPPATKQTDLDELLDTKSWRGN